MAERAKIFLLIPHLGGGGAEGIIEMLAEHLPAEDSCLHLVLVTRQFAELRKALPAHLTVHQLPHAKVRYAAVALLRLIWQERPRILLSGIHHLNLLLLGLRPFFPRQTRLLIRQNSSWLLPQHPSRLQRALYRRLYQRADAVLCQSAAMAREMAQRLALPVAHFPVLANPVDIAAIQSATPATAESDLAAWFNASPRLIAVGRLSPEKGFDLLLEAFGHVRQQHPRAGLLILGAGPEESFLRAESERLGLGASLHFGGYRRPTAAWLQAATVFVLSSRHDAMPNALLEAAAAGLPIVSTPASTGLVPLIAEQPGIWLATEATVPALTESLCDALRALGPLPERYRHAWIEAYALAPALAAYQALLEGFARERQQ